MDWPPKEIITPAYVALYPRIQVVAVQHGYSVGVHGTASRDFDLIAAPWEDKISDAKTLIEAIASACGGTIPTHKKLPEGVFPNPTEKPHGRQVWTILIGYPRYIDISVLTREGGQVSPAPLTTTT